MEATVCGARSQHKHIGFAPQPVNCLCLMCFQLQCPRERRLREHPGEAGGKPQPVRDRPVPHGAGHGHLQLRSAAGTAGLRGVRGAGGLGTPGGDRSPPRGGSDSRRAVPAGKLLESRGVLVVITTVLGNWVIFPAASQPGVPGSCWAGLCSVTSKLCLPEKHLKWGF